MWPSGLIQVHSLELRGHLVMFQSGFTFTVNWLMHKSGWVLDSRSEGLGFDSYCWSCVEV